MRSGQSWLQSLPLQSFQHLSDQKRCQLCFSCVLFCFVFPISMNSSQQNKQLSKKAPRSAKAELSCAIPIYIGSDSLLPDTREGQFMLFALPWFRRWSHGLMLMSALRHAKWPLSCHAVDPGSFPCLTCLSRGHACSSNSGSKERSPPTWDNSRYILLEPYSSSIDINIINNVIQDHPLAQQPHTSAPQSIHRVLLGMHFLGCPGFAISRPQSTAIWGGQSQPPVTLAQLQQHEQARF